ncbi:GMP synthase [Dirofilaria immitis]
MQTIFLSFCSIKNTKFFFIQITDVHHGTKIFQNHFDYNLCTTNGPSKLIEEIDLMQEVSERLRLLLPDEILTVFIEQLAFRQFTPVQ